MPHTGRNPSRAFTLVELLVVIGIIAVLIGILLPVIARARKQANTVACSATLRMIGQTLFIYAGENKGSMPYGYYRSDFYASPDANLADEADPNTAVFVWWSVLRSYQRRGTTSDNGSVKGVTVNGRAVRALRPDFAVWEVVLDAGQAGRCLRAHAEDAAGNVEKLPHVMDLP